MSDAPVLRERGLPGRPPKNAKAFLARTLPTLAARYVRSCRRALAYLNDPATPIDANWVKLFNSVADRIGHPRMTAQTVDARSVGVSASFVEMVAPVSSAGPVSDGEALAYLEARVAALRAARALTEGGD